MDIKDYGFLNKRFSTLASTCLKIHFFVGSVLTAAIAFNLISNDKEKFSCPVDTIHVTVKGNIQDECWNKYNDTHTSLMRFWSLFLSSLFSVVLVSAIYFYAVQIRIDEIERYLTKRNEAQAGDKKKDKEPSRNTFYVFIFYFIHLVMRSMLGVLFAYLQYNVLYPNGFVSDFHCEYGNSSQANSKGTTPNNGNASLSTVICTHSGAKDKQFLATIVFAYNIVFTIITLAEGIHLILYQFVQFNILSCLAEPKTKPPWSCDSHFIIEYFLQLPYESDDIDFRGVNNCAAKSCKSYKENILKCLSTLENVDVNFLPKTSVADMFIDLVIQTGRALQKFTKNVRERHEIEDVYMKFPEDSIRLEKIEDLFQPNKDTENQSPRTIAVVGRPGIGKTVLTKKIMYDWAKGDVAFYRGKIVFLLKFRYFSLHQYQMVSLKEFLRFGTNLKKDEFEEIFNTVLHSPEKVIIIFDGLDEFCSNLNDFQNYVQESQLKENDPSISMAPMLLLVKIMYGFLLDKATILVTTRPTACDACSKIDFNREVEIIGFTSDKIEEYVRTFCSLNKKPVLNDKIWNHIQSSPELKNLCYIPVNCYIICATLSSILCDSSRNSSLPGTLTGLYDVASIHFHENHCPLEKRNKGCTCIKQLQMLAFNEMEKDNLVFEGRCIDKQMKESGLLHCLPVPIPRTPKQFCFIHLTIQEFLAAKYIVEMKEIIEIEEFISSCFKQARWHLVLQFLAGLLGKKMKDSNKKNIELRECFLHFRQYLKDDQKRLALDTHNLLAMKCLRETQDESICSDVATTSSVRCVTTIYEYAPSKKRIFEFSPSDGAAVAFVCKHLSSLTCLQLGNINNWDVLREFTRIAQEKCVSELDFLHCDFGDLGLKHLLDVLTNSKCHMNHQHCQLNMLTLSVNKVTDIGVSYLVDFLEKGHRSCSNTTSCGIPQPDEVLNHGVCDQLRELTLDNNNIGDKGVENLCKALVTVQSKLTTLSLESCSLTSECASWLANVVSDENCEITDLSLAHNEIGDEGVHVLCPALIQSKVTRLSLQRCSLTSECTSWLGDVLSDENCEITDLTLRDNDIGDEGVRVLCGALLTIAKPSKLEELNLAKCSLTDKCPTALFEVLCYGFCGLKTLILFQNEICDQGVAMLCCALRKKQCTLTELNIMNCSLTDKCVPSFCGALTDKVCGLRILNLNGNALTDKHLSLLSNAVRNEHCHLTCLPFPNEVLTEEGEVLLQDIRRSCALRRQQVT